MKFPSTGNRTRVAAGGHSTTVTYVMTRAVPQPEYQRLWNEKVIIEWLIGKLFNTASSAAPSDSTVSEEARMEPRTVATLTLAVRRFNHYARSHPDWPLLFHVQANQQTFVLSDFFQQLIMALTLTFIRVPCAPGGGKVTYDPDLIWSQYFRVSYP